VHIGCHQSGGDKHHCSATLGVLNSPQPKDEHSRDEGREAEMDEQRRRGIADDDAHRHEGRRDHRRERSATFALEYIQRRRRVAEVVAPGIEAEQCDGQSNEGSHSECGPRDHPPAALERPKQRQQKSLLEA
jgi:nicotinamidase-related amidase